jgi:RNA polymerase sigma-70 factor, ECF subfamily
MSTESTQSDARIAAGGDLDLVHASKKGDVEAFEQLIKRYHQRLLRIAQSVTRNREASQDALQETFLKAFQKLGDFREDSRFSTWLFRIALNQSLMKVRKQRTIREVSLDETFGPHEDVSPFEVPDPAAAPEELCWASELRGIFLKALQELRPILQTVFILRDVEGLTIDQTAKVPSVSQEAVKARLWRACLQLRECLNRRLSARAGFSRNKVSRRDLKTHRISGLFVECLHYSIPQTHSTTPEQAPHLSPAMGANASGV